MKKTLNVGLVGYKFMGKAHSSGWSRVGMFFDPGCEIKKKALCGRDAEWVRKSADSLGWEDTETDYRALIKRDDIDIIDITTPSNYHAEVAIAAAEAKKHIFCEKPLALTLADARAMVAAVEANGVKNQIGFNYRFLPAIRLARKLIKDGRIGKIFHFRGVYLQDWIIDPSFPLVWRLEKDIAGSGSLGDLGAHVIDLARYLVDEIDCVTGMSRTFVKERPIVEKMEGLQGVAQENAQMGKVTVDDATLFLCEFKNGALGTFEATRFAQGHKNNLTFEINGEKGSIRFSLERLNELEYLDATLPLEIQGYSTILATDSGHDYVNAWWPPGHVLGWDHTFVHEFYDLVCAINEDKPASPGFYDGMKCSQIMEAVEKSCEERAWVTVDT